MNEEELHTLMADARMSMANITEKVARLDDAAFADEIEELRTDLEEVLEIISDTLEGYNE